jgi:hypothetical protein
MNQSRGIGPVEPFKQFHERIARTRYADLAATDPHYGSPGREAQATLLLAEIRNKYGALPVHATIRDRTGRIFDCVSADEQPALIRSGKPLAVPSGMPLKSRSQKRFQPDPLADLPNGTFPVRRVTPESLLGLRDLTLGMRKGCSPIGALSDAPAVVTSGHRYAHGSQKLLRAIGVRTVLNVWQPTIRESETFSLSQLWFCGNAPEGIQTLEVGWQVSPELNGTAAPTLFTFWTPNGYNNSGPGAYNDANSFVQLPNALWKPGATFNQVSAINGDQVELEVGYMLQDGNWWLYVGGTGPADAVGYFPASLFGTGDLASQATSLDFGGETLSLATAPLMGSGNFAATGAGRTAYQRNITYVDPTGTPKDATLSLAQDTPQYYTIISDSTFGWGTAIRFGGPGGNGVA